MLGYLLKSIGLILVYLAAAKIGLLFGTLNGSVTIFWPPGGIALAVLLLGGVRYIPAVFVGAYLAGVMVDAPLIFGFGSAVGNTLEPYIGYLLVGRYGKNRNPDLNNISSLLSIVFWGGMIPSLASATFGPLALLASSLINTGALPEIMWRWWRADVLGVAFFTPLILAFVPKRPFFGTPERFLEILMLWVAAIMIGQMIFLDWTPVSFIRYPLGLAWVFPVLIWSGLRTGRRNTLLIQLMFLAQALASAHFKIGVFADDFARYGLSNFWMFAMLLAVIGKGFAITATAERRAAERNARHAKVFEVGHDGVLIADADNNIISANAAFTEITGYTEGEVSGKNPRLLSSGRQSRAFYAAMWASLLEHGHWQGELWNRRKDGEIFLTLLTIHTVKDGKDRVVSRVCVFTDITSQRAAEDSLAHQAQHDFLTNLPNRLLFRDRFSQQLAFATRHQKRFAVIYLDLDSFKPVNDKFGHQVGDELLIAVAERLAALVREIDTVSRFGGDEFAILVSEVDTVGDVITLADKVLKALNEPFMLDGHSISISGSLGIALYPTHGENLETLMNAADAAMYQAKQVGDTFAIATH